ncbi:hypothetical protein BRC81_04460 [Halobacteriales archaeon QS_1_68_20]|nr:MAG: hypothetical protein BRC81_04460 [Halobacteriales archaeon QS_1_68_20]
MDVRVVQEQAALSHRTEKVIVTVGRPPGERHPELHREIERSVEDRVGHEVVVDVRVSLVVSR